MVRPFLAALALALAAGNAAAQTVDWRNAGGDLFGRPAAQPASDLAGLADLPPRLPPLSQPFMDAIAAAAERHGIDPKMLHALVIVESAYRVDAGLSGRGGRPDAVDAGNGGGSRCQRPFRPDRESEMAERIIWSGNCSASGTSGLRSRRIIRDRIVSPGSGAYRT